MQGGNLMKERTLVYAFIVVGSLVQTMTISMIIAGWSTFVRIAPIVLWMLMVGSLTTVTVFLLYKATHAWYSIRERHQDHIHAHENHMLEQYLAKNRLASDELGNYPVPLDYQSHRSHLYLPPGNSSNPTRITQVAEKKMELAQQSSSLVQVKPARSLPSQDYLIAQLASDEPHTFSPGVRVSNGEVVKVNLKTVPHIKVVTSTGMGKSSLSAAILNQLTTLNTPDVFRIALLDLEHKTSRLFEDLPHVFTMQDRQRRVSLVSHDADEVEYHLTLLNKELKRRTKLSEHDLEREPVLLIYIEEILSLQYEIVQPKKLKRMLGRINNLAVRCRKFRMFLLICTQTDYVNIDIRDAQQQFRFKAGSGINVNAARAAGFHNMDLIKENFKNSAPGEFVVEYPSFSDSVLAPRYDVKKLLLEKSSPSSYTPIPLSRSLEVMKTPETQDEKPNETVWEAREWEVKRLLAEGKRKVAIIKKVWGVKAGGTIGYRKASLEYNEMIKSLEQER